MLYLFGYGGNMNDIQAKKNNLRSVSYVLMAIFTLAVFSLFYFQDMNGIVALLIMGIIGLSFLGLAIFRNYIFGFSRPISRQRYKLMWLSYIFIFITQTCVAWKVSL